MEEKGLHMVELEHFEQYLYKEEKRPATIEKYMRDVIQFLNFVGAQQLSKEVITAYKQHLLEKQYAINSINSVLASIHALLQYLGLGQWKVKLLRKQKRAYCSEEQELTRQEYMKLLEAARDEPQLCLLMKTICGTGIRVSELPYFTVEAVRSGEIEVQCKNKIRVVLLPKKLRQMLLEYSRKNHITSGPIFVTRNGNPLNRSNIWSRMKRICKKAGVNEKKVFPHNLRKLFARTFYDLEKDIAKLADILGHSSIETTRIYIMSTSVEHRRKIERLGLIL